MLACLLFNRIKYVSMWVQAICIKYDVCCTIKPKKLNLKIVRYFSIQIVARVFEDS